MDLRLLLEGIDIVAVDGSLEVGVTGIAYDSRKVTEGGLFIAVSGEHFDGGDFVGGALENGAAAVLTEGVRPKGAQSARATFVTVPDARAAMARAAANYYGNPSGALTTVGITGTNGKTTTAFLIRSILKAGGVESGLIGTINYYIKDKKYPALHTTPEAVDFQKLLGDMLKAGLTHAVTEVSSHALALKRADATAFDVAVFTNLTHEHLDFHHSMQEYFAAKRRLFSDLLSPKGAAVINVDDTYGRALTSLFAGDAGPSRLFDYAIKEPARLRATDILSSFGGLEFSIIEDGKPHRVSSSFVGTPNVYNILSASAAARAMGLSWESIQDGIAALKNVSGRFERITLGQDFLLVIDYAHTSDALRSMLITAGEVAASTGGRVITVFGCGGDRDRDKRPLMGAAAADLSDVAVITTDNPRGEDPLGIIEDIKAGIGEKKGRRCVDIRVVPDRKEAIFEAVNAAHAGDVVVIAGKGHEDYQEIDGARYPFSDRTASEEAIKNRMEG